MVGRGVSPLGSMLRAQALVGRRLLGASWRRELGTLCSAGAEIDTDTGADGWQGEMLCQREECPTTNAHST